MSVWLGVRGMLFVIVLWGRRCCVTWDWICVPEIWGVCAMLRVSACSWDRVCVAVCVSLLRGCVGGDAARLGQCVCAPLRLCISVLSRCRGKVRASPGLLPENSGAAL